MTSNYLHYKANYLHDRPRSVIKRCLERKSNGQKYAKEDVSCTENTNGTFQVKGKSNTPSIDFGKDSLEPSWFTWKISCNHFFAIFKFYPRWNWYALPSTYLSSEYLSSDTCALTSSLSMMTSNNHLNEEIHVQDQLLMEIDENKHLMIFPIHVVHVHLYTRIYSTCI